MSLQQRIVHEYRAKFPGQTLREVSARTNIQLTRVFRLFNGAAMKLDEYERFHQLVHGSREIRASHAQFYRLSEELLRQCNETQLGRLTRLLERQLRWNELSEPEMGVSTKQITA